MQYSPRRLARRRSNRVIPATLLSMATLLAAVPALLAQEGGEAAATESGHSPLELILHGGPLIITVWLMIVAASVIMVTFIIQNFLSLRKVKLAPPELVQTLRSTMADGNYQETWEVCEANPCYLSNVLKVGLERLGRGKDSAENALLAAAAYESQNLKSRNAYLSVIGVVSPMIGLLGTVIGMMKAFATLGAEGTSNPRALSAAIGEVLMATAAGLFIAIPAFIFYYVFRNLAQDAIVYTDDIVTEMMEDIPFSELDGVRVGNQYAAGQA
jgi:biopolymer transport protein ExbB